MTLAGDPARLAGILSARSGSGCQVDLRLPKFELTAKSDLVRDLPLLGVRKVFTGAADFSPLTDDLIYVNEAAQKTFFSVDEKGCEAAAYTYYADKRAAWESATPTKRTLHFDRPFLFAVMRDGAPLFIGVVSNPAAK